MKNARIRLRWFNLGSLLTTLFFLWLMSQEEEKAKESGWAGDNPSKMDEIYNHYKEKQNA